MLIVFISNFYNHHQAPLSMAMHRLTNGDYYFIETEPIAEERVSMGWGISNYPTFVLKFYESDKTKALCSYLINQADVVIVGSAPDYLIKKRLTRDKLTFRYSERIFKAGFKWYELPARSVLYYFRHGRYKNLYMLCASAYTAADYAKTGTFLNKTYKWGYFPEVKQYDDFNLMCKSKNEVSILWVGRLIEWKHPDDCIHIAQRLKETGYKFELTIIGNGEMEQQLHQMVTQYHLDDYVSLLGAMSPNQIREYMERSNIYLFTSDFNEGWGAVLNESMNSGCAVIASHAIGSAPYLIEDGENGLIYKNGEIEDLYRKVKYLFDFPDIRMEFGRKAYRALTETWNAEVAAVRFLKLVEELICGNKNPDLYDFGPCSKAEKLKNDWYMK